jgi:hypothetical protein
LNATSEVRWCSGARGEGKTGQSNQDQQARDSHRSNFPGSWSRGGTVPFCLAIGQPWVRAGVTTRAWIAAPLQPDTLPRIVARRTRLR